jgi:hypothetical protein
VVGQLADFPPQFTLGLFGDWGAGKSTILEEVGRQLRTDEATSTAFVLFDAWRFEDDSLRRELIRTVGESLKQQEALKKGFDLERHIEPFEKETTTATRRLGFDLAALRDGVLAALLVAAIVVALIFALPKLGASRDTTLKFLVAMASAVTAFLLFAMQRVLVADPVQSTRRRLEFPDQFASSFETLLQNVATKRLVIAIDNLDRCAPARVTEMLSAVKTFLEPAFEGKAAGEQRRSPRRWISEELRDKPPEDSLERMCFIIAADDAALRRHLTAQELSKESRGRGGDGELPDEVRTAVDEYLRKFFGAHLRIRDLLDEDVRRFSEVELEDFNRSQELPEDLAGRLIEMTSQGLKRNPRRIKQFVNNLQLRLQILTERRAKNRIQIDPQVLVVAKLAIIEEEFSESYEELQGDPTLLATWHRVAREPEENVETKLDPRLADFVRFTDDIQPSDIRPYLTLKQTKDEVELPLYGEFIDLLDAGDTRGLERLLEAAETQQERYAEAATAHLDTQRQTKSWSRAHNAIRGIIEVPLLRGVEGDLARHAIELALQQPPLEERLRQLDPANLLDVAADCGLGADHLRRVVRQVTEALAEEGTVKVRPRLLPSIAMW